MSPRATLPRPFAVVILVLLVVAVVAIWARNRDIRGRHEANLELPPRRQPNTAHVVFETDAMGDTTKDWTFWSTPRFE